MFKVFDPNSGYDFNFALQQQINGSQYAYLQWIVQNIVFSKCIIDYLTMYNLIAVINPP